MKIINKVSTNLKIEINKRRPYDPQKINWAIIGTGPMAAFFCKALLVTNRNVIAVTSRNKDKATRFAKKYRIKYNYNNIDEMLRNKNIDIVYIATPVFTHFEISKKCIEYGKNILVEKPLSYSLEQTKILIDLAQQNDIFMMEALWSKCLPTFQKLKKIINNNQFGKLTNIKVELSKMVEIDSSREEFKPNHGGVLLDYGVYPLSLVLDLMSEYSIEHVLTKYNFLNLDSTWVIELSDNNISANIIISNEYSGSNNAFFYFDNAIVVLPNQFNRTNKIEIYDRMNRLEEIVMFDYSFEGFENQIKEVEQCIQEGKKESSLVNHKSTYKTIELMSLLQNLNERD